jgi:virginiamycin B lyase
MRVALDGGPYAVAASPDGALWVTLADAGKIARVTMDGEVQEFKAGKKPMQITPRGWFTFAGGVGRITPDGIVTTTKVHGSPYGIVEGPDNAVWFTAENVIGRFNGKFEWYATPSTAAMIATGPDGALWFTMNATSSVGRITLDGKLTVRELPTREAGPVGICGTHDAVWFTELLANQLGRIGVDDAVQELPLADNAKPHAVIPAQSDGVWVSLWGAHAIAHISGDGEYAEIPLEHGAEPHGMAVGADGALWVACEAGYVERIS